MAQQPWTRDEQLAAFDLFCRTPLSRLNPEYAPLAELAAKSNRSPEELFGYLAGIENPVEFLQGLGIDWENFVLESHDAISRLSESLELFDLDDPAADGAVLSGPAMAETTTMTHARLIGEFLRDAVLAAYENRCAMCNIDDAEKLTAVYIVPWDKDPTRRADPSNGVCLCGEHARAFKGGMEGLDLRMPSRFLPDR